MSTPRHVVVTGGCGFLGQHIVRRLHARFPNAVITAADLRATAWVAHVESSKLAFSDSVSVDGPAPGHVAGPRPSTLVRYIDCDITNVEAVRQALVDRVRVENLPPVDVIVHTASPHISMPEKLLWNVNVNGTKVLLEEGKRAGVRVFVHTSSASVAMDKNLTMINVDETAPLVVDPLQSPEYYALTKALAEAEALKANDRSARFLTCAIRPAGIFGECDAQLLPGLIDASRAGKSRVLIGDDTNRFDFTYVGNIALAHILAIEKLLDTVDHLDRGDVVAGGGGEKGGDGVTVDGSAFFITNDEPVYFWDFARAAWQLCGDYRPRSNQICLPAWFALGIASIGETVTDLLGLPKPKLTRGKAQFSTITRVFDISRAKDVLGYVPEVKLEAALKQSMRWHLGG